MEYQRLDVNSAFLQRFQYVVPSYQRNYVWTRQDQWEPLWDDVVNVAQQILDDDSKKEPHFLGTIITKHMSSGDSLLQLRSVVDGQQRLTTLQLLIAAAHSAFRELELEDFAATLGGYLSNQDHDVKQDHDRFKIRHKSRDYAGFSDVVNFALGKSNAADIDSRANGKLPECYGYFREAMTDWLRCDAGENLSKRGNALRITIVDMLVVLDIRLGSENSHAIFEALNARGEPLTEWEKTKNYILSIAVNENDPDGDQAYANHLECYDSDEYWDQRVTTPRFSGKRIDLFLFFFAQIELPKWRQEIASGEELHNLPRRRLYREFRYVGEHVYRHSREELQGLLERMGRHTEIYREIDPPGSDKFSDYGRLVMQRRETLTLASLIPVFMVLVDKLGYGEELDCALRIVDSYLMRRVALKASYSNFDDASFDHVQALREAPRADVCAVLIDRFEKATKANYWPSDEDVAFHLRKADMYNNISAPKKRLLLSGIAQKMHQEKDKDLTMPFKPKDNLTVEHVAPQGWERHWKEDLKFGDSDEHRQQLNGLVHRIGNLTLVTQSLNTNLGNNPWPYKAELLEKDNLLMNRRLVSDMEGDTWNETEINRRSQTIVGYVSKIWPHAAALRAEFEIPTPNEDPVSQTSGISSTYAQHLVDSVTETGIDEGWADKDGLHRRWRDGRYGRYLNLGGGGTWRCVWFGVSSRNRQLVLSYSEPSDHADEFILLPEDDGVDELIETVTGQVRGRAEAIAESSEAHGVESHSG
ncbi:MAG: DUF262 domain-containing protein [Gammaproteobacteria bacterium]|nr:DUF262 domain-containing protein [Gammaproteobacteria bacterium]MYD03118.1 DUF262 domain-containing protein [Gammaproteobacteria bacterium]MYI25741.1 DUF262 domain-containing protein [Gammaproteobacteria bacterium]